MKATIEDDNFQIQEQVKEPTKEELMEFYQQEQLKLQAQINEMKQKEEMQEWNEFDESTNQQPVLLSEFEHKSHLINPMLKKKIKHSTDLINKEISLSYLDNETAFIYANKLTAAEEWFNLGFKKLAQRRQVHLLIKLGIKKSVDGFERLLQTAIAQAQVNLTPEGQGVLNLPTEQEAGGSGGIGMSSPFKFNNIKNAFKS